MSESTVDDLLYAEELLFLRQSPDEVEYCRPSCGFMDYDLTGQGGDDACTDDTCGCPCGHPGSTRNQQPKEQP